MPLATLTAGDDLIRIADGWDELWRRTPGATPFQSPHWLLPWWTAFGGGELHTVAATHNGTLELLAPLYIVRDEDAGESLGMLLGTGVSDYLDILAPEGTAGPIAEALASAGCQMWDLQQLRANSPLLTTPVPAGWQEQVEEQDRCPVLALDRVGDELENLLSASARKKLRYYHRCAARRGPVSYIAATEENIDQMLDALFQLHEARWRQRGLPGVLADEVVQRFHRDAARRLLGAGALRLHAMRIGDEIAAIFYGFSHQGTVYYYLSGYDPSLEKLSPGTSIVAHAIEQAVREGAQWFDFLRGAEEYKYAWGAIDRINTRRVLIRGT